MLLGQKEIRLFKIFHLNCFCVTSLFPKKDVSERRPNACKHVRVCAKEQFRFFLSQDKFFLFLQMFFGRRRKLKVDTRKCGDEGIDIEIRPNIISDTKTDKHRSSQVHLCTEKNMCVEAGARNSRTCSTLEILQTKSQHLRLKVIQVPSVRPQCSSLSPILSLFLSSDPRW